MQGAALLGVALIVFSALSLATKGVAIKYLHADDVGVITMIFLRNLGATPFFWAIALWRVGGAQMFNVRPSVMAAAAGAGAFCYYLGGLADFASLEFIDAGVQRMLLFTYPAMVVLLDSLWRRGLPPRRQVLALATTTVGLFLVLGGLESGIGGLNRWGVLLALFAASTVAVYLMVNQTYARLIGSIRFLIYAQTGALAAMACHFVVSFEPVDLDLRARAWLTLAYLSLFVAVMTWLAMAEGVRIIGASRAALVSTVGPPATLLLAYWFLGEVMSPGQLAGAAVIILSIVALEARLPQSRARPAEAATKR